MPRHPNHCYNRGVRTRPELLLLCAALVGCHPLGSLPPIDTGVEGNDEERLSVSPLQLDFGEVEFGAVAEQEFTIHNLGDTTVYVSGQGDPVGDPGFEVLAPDVAELSPGSDLSLTVRFVPTGDEQADAQLLVAPADAVVRLSGLGRSPVLQTGDPQTPPVVLGCSGEGTMTVSNAGSRTLDITDVSSSTSVFQIVDWPASLAPGENGDVRYTFTPDIGGSAEGVFVLVTNDPSGSTSVAHGALGYEGEGVSESFVYMPTDPTDIVFVVDGSTIGPYSSRIAGAAEAYVDALRSQNTDFQLTSVSSASACPAAPPYATRLDTALRASTVLARGFSADGGPWDDDLLALALAVVAGSGPSGCLEGFRRADADLEVVVVALGPSGADLAADLVNLQAGGAGRVRVSALVPTTGSCGTRADDYLAVASTTSGATEDLCDADWTPAFQTFAQLPGGTESVRYPLSQVPVASTIAVSVGGVPHSGWAWEADTNQIVFDSAEFSLGAEVDISYVAAVACE